MGLGIQAQQQIAKAPIVRCPNKSNQIVFPFFLMHATLDMYRVTRSFSSRVERKDTSRVSMRGLVENSSPTRSAALPVVTTPLVLQSASITDQPDQRGTQPGGRIAVSTPVPLRPRLGGRGRLDRVSAPPETTRYKPETNTLGTHNNPIGTHGRWARNEVAAGSTTAAYDFQDPSVPSSTLSWAQSPETAPSRLSLTKIT